MGNVSAEVTTLVAQWATFYYRSSMLETLTAAKTEEMSSVMSAAQCRLHSIHFKLQAFGILLERQSESEDGFVELRGLGFALQDLGKEVREIWDSLDSMHNMNQSD